MLLCTPICGGWGCLLWFWISWFSESGAYPKKVELDGLEAMQHSYNFTYSFRNNLVRIYYVSNSASDPVDFVNEQWSSLSSEGSREGSYTIEGLNLRLA